MKRIPEQTVQEIFSSVDITRIIGDFIRLEKKGGRYWGCCPFHNEKTPSFSVDKEKNFFYCFGCQKGGNTITFLMELEKFTYVEALEYLAEKSGITIRYDEEAEQSHKENHLKDDTLDLIKRTQLLFHYFLLNSEEGKEAYQYLIKRGLTKETIEKFKIGWAPKNRKWLYGFLQKKGFSKEFLAKSGLFSIKYPEYSFFSDRIMFTICSIKGEPIAFGGRTLKEGPKYINSSDSLVFHKSDILYALYDALPTIKKEKQVILCEGYMDAVSLHQAGFTNAVAPLGTSLTENHIKLLKRWAEKFILLFDADDAGQNAARKAIFLATKAKVEVLVAIPDTGKDPSEILQHEGDEALKKIINSAINSFEYLVKRVQKIYNIDTIEGKSKSAEYLFEYAELLESDIKREAFFDLCSNTLGIDINAIKHDFKQRYMSTSPKTVIKKTVQDKKHIDRELYFLLAIIANRQYFAKVRNSVKVEDLESPTARSLFIALEESYRNEDSDFEQFSQRIKDDDVRSLVIMRTMSEEFRIYVDKTIQDGLKMVKIKSLERKREHLITELKRGRIDDVNSRGSFDELIYEKMYIDTELEKLKDVRE